MPRKVVKTAGSKERSSKARGVYSGATLRDGVGGKTIPASLASLIAAIRLQWPSRRGFLEEGVDATLQWYQKDLDPHLLGAIAEVQTKYTFESHSTIMQGIQQLERGNFQLKYWQIRIISDWVGLSVAQLLMFSHFVSIERRCENGKGDRAVYLRELLQEYEDVLGVFRSLVEEGLAGQTPIFYEYIPAPHDFRPRIEVLERLVKAAGRKLCLTEPDSTSEQVQEADKL
jgi:hypothetical protein